MDLQHIVLDIIQIQKVNKCEVIKMTVGEMIALLCKYASNNDELLMAKSVDSVEVKDDGVYVYFTDGNTQDYLIPEEG